MLGRIDRPASISVCLSVFLREKNWCGSVKMWYRSTFAVFDCTVRELCYLDRFTGVDYVQQGGRLVALLNASA